MPKITDIDLTVQHTLRKSVAIGRIKDIIKGIRDQFEHTTGAKGETKGNEATFSFWSVGLLVSGSLVVECSQIKINIKSPFMFSIEPKIKNVVEGLLK